MIRLRRRDRSTPRLSRYAVVVTLVLVVAASAASAAGTTTVRVAAADTISTSETTTVELVVSDANSGVGAYNATVALGDPSIARITDVALRGDPAAATSRVDLADDGSSVTIAAALMDTADSGDVTIAELTVRGVAAGSTSFDLTVTALGDERGESYVTQTRTERLSVTERQGGSSGDTGGSDDADDTGESDDADDTGGSDNADNTDEPPVVTSQTVSTEGPVTPTTPTDTTTATGGGDDTSSERNVSARTAGTDEATSAEAVPGFDVLASLAALAVLALLASRRIE